MKWKSIVFQKYTLKSVYTIGKLTTFCFKPHYRPFTIRGWHYCKLNRELCGIDMSRAHNSATIQNINTSDGHDDTYIYLFVRLANHELITVAHYPNCRHFLARYDSLFIFVCSFVGNPFATGGGLRKFMGFLHEITRKHNPCPLRRMSPRDCGGPIPFALLHCSSLSFSLFFLFFSLSFPALYARSPVSSAFHPRFHACFCWSLDRETCRQFYGIWSVHSCTCTQIKNITRSFKGHIFK